MWIFYEKWWVVLVMTEPPTVDIHVDNRLTRTSCPLSPCFSALFKKISTPSDRHRGMTFRPLWVFCVLGLYRKNELWDTKFAANNVQKGEYGSIGKKLALRYSFWRNWVSGRRIFRYRPILFSFCFLPIPKKYLQGNLSSIDPTKFLEQLFNQLSISQ